MKKRTCCFMALVVMAACTKNVPLQPQNSSYDTSAIPISAVQADVYENQPAFNPMQFIYQSNYTVLKTLPTLTYFHSFSNVTKGPQTHATGILKMRIDSVSGVDSAMTVRALVFDSMDITDEITGKSTQIRSGECTFAILGQTVSFSCDSIQADSQLIQAILRAPSGTFTAARNQWSVETVTYKGDTLKKLAVNFQIQNLGLHTGTDYTFAQKYGVLNLTLGTSLTGSYTEQKITLLSINSTSVDTGKFEHVAYELTTVHQRRPLKIADVCPIGPDCAMAVGDTWAMATTDGGKTWQGLPLPTLFAPYAVFFLNKDRGWCMDINCALSTKDGGMTWNKSMFPAPLPCIGCMDLGVVGMHFFNENEGHGLLRTGYFVKTIDGGSSWHVAQSAPIASDYCFSDTKHGFIPSNFAMVYKTSDGGSTWTPMVTDSQYTIQFCHFPSSQIGFLTGEGIILKTVNGGSSWSPIKKFPGKPLGAVYFFNNSEGLVSCPDGAVLATKDGGATWNSRPFLSNDQIAKYKFLPSGEGWVITQVGTLLHTTDRGSSWSRIVFSRLIHP